MLVILWYSTLAEYMEGVISKEKFIERITDSGKGLAQNKYKSSKFFEILDDMAFLLPSEVGVISKELKLHNN